jgi:cupin fold WbuC family metalloprotein
MELGCLEKIKIPSGELTNLPLLRYMSRFGKPLLLSTGMANLGEIEAAIEAIEAAGTPRHLITVLHCTTEYPTPMKEVNLQAMVAMKNTFGVSTGYSDHTELKDELLIAIRGLMALVTFDEQGEVIGIVRLGIGRNGEEFPVGAEVPAGTWHTVIALESGSILLEVKAGPFDPNQAKNLAPWAPNELSPAASPYLNQLITSAGLSHNRQISDAGAPLDSMARCHNPIGS